MDCIEICKVWASVLNPQSHEENKHLSSKLVFVLYASCHVDLFVNQGPSVNTVRVIIGQVGHVLHYMRAVGGRLLGRLRTHTHTTLQMNVLLFKC